VARLLLLGKGAVSAHRFERSLAVEMDETQQRPDVLKSLLRGADSAVGMR
jgi:hypothetical protein